MLYGLILISAPNMIYVISGVSNDALTMPAVAIFMLGIIRFYEKKYNILTYFVIAAGINLSLLSKLTTGMIVCIIALGIVLFTFFKEKKIKSIINWRFFITLPLYGVSVIYFWKVYKRFHTIQPNYKALAEQEFVQMECIAILILVDRWGYGSIFVISSRNLWERGIHLPDIPICRVRIPHCHLIWGSVVLLLLQYL